MMFVISAMLRCLANRSGINFRVGYGISNGYAIELEYIEFVLAHVDLVGQLM